MSNKFHILNKPHIKKMRLTIKLIAMTLVYCLFAQPLLYAAPNNAIASSTSLPAIMVQDQIALNSVKLPFENVALHSTYKGKSDKTIILFQDAHANYSGQKNLSQALKKIILQNQTKLVLVEGSHHDVSLNHLRQQAPAAKWKKAADQLLVDGIIAGEEHLNLTSDLPMQLIGIEDQTLYAQNLTAFGKLSSMRKDSIRFIQDVRLAINRIKPKLYSARAYELDSILTKYKDDIIGLINALNKLMESTKLNKASYPQVFAAYALHAEESLIDFNKANAQQTELLKQLANRGHANMVREFQKQSIHAKQSPLMLNALYEQLQISAMESGLNITIYSELMTYWDYLRQFSRLNMQTLLVEVKTLEQDLFTEFLNTDEQRLLRVTDQFFMHLDQAVKIKLTNADYAWLTKYFASFRDMAWQAFLNRQLMQLGYFEDVLIYQSQITELETVINEFYELVQLRDDAFVANALQALDAQAQTEAFLIAGGYHTEHITSLLRQKSVSYIVLTPGVEYETDYARYEAFLLSDAKALDFDSTPATSASLDDVANPVSSTIRYGAFFDSIPANRFEAAGLYRPQLVAFLEDMRVKSSRMASQDNEFDDTGILSEEQLAALDETGAMQVLDTDEVVDPVDISADLDDLVKPQSIAIRGEDESIEIGGKGQGVKGHISLREQTKQILFTIGQAVSPGQKITVQDGLNWVIQYDAQTHMYFVYFRYLNEKGEWIRHASKTYFHTGIDGSSGEIKPQKMGSFSIGRGDTDGQNHHLRINGTQINPMTLAGINQADRLRLQAYTNALKPIQTVLLNRGDEIIIVDADTTNANSRIRINGRPSNENSNVRTLAKNLRAYFEGLDKINAFSNTDTPEKSLDTKIIFLAEPRQVASIMPDLHAFEITVSQIKKDDGVIHAQVHLPYEAVHDDPEDIAPLLLKTAQLEDLVNIIREITPPSLEVDASDITKGGSIRIADDALGTVQGQLYSIERNVEFLKSIPYSTWIHGESIASTSTLGTSRQLLQPDDKIIHVVIDKDGDILAIGAKAGVYDFLNKDIAPTNQNVQTELDLKKAYELLLVVSPKGGGYEIKHLWPKEKRRKLATAAGFSSIDSLSGSSAIEVVGQSDIGSIRRDPLGNLIDITLEQFKLGDKARRGLKAKHNPIHSGPAIQLMWNNQILMPWLVEESMKGDDCEADCVQKLNALEINDLDHEIKELLAAGEREAAISLLSEYETDVRITPYQSNMIFGNRTGEIVLNMTSQENPDSLEQYVIEGVVAQGGMGMIFRAQRYTRRKDSTADSFEDQGSVVIKVLLPRKADTYLEDRKNLSQSFSNFEAAILRNKDNPSIEEWMRLYKSHKAPKLSKDLKAYAANTKRSNEFKAIRQSHAATLGVLEKSGAFNKGLNLPLFIDSLIQFIEVSKEFLNALNDIEKRFEREIRVVSQLEHDHIAQAINWGMITGKQGEAVSVKINHTNRDGSVREATEPEEIVFMVLEDAGKTNLSALLRSYGGMPWERARQITLKIAHALAYAHSQGKVHRDVKAGNVTIDETGEPKLVDFGIAGIIESASGTLTNAAGTITRDGVAIGSLDSMDTGQATDTKQVNAQNDMGALGKLLYHLITGSFDHPGRNRQERFLQRYSDNRPVNVYHLPGDYILPTKLKKLNKIINKLLKRENHTGYRNMFEVINALATIGYEEAKPAGPVEIRPDGGEDSILPDIPKEFLRELSGSAFFKTVDIEGITFKPYTNGRVQATFYMRNKVKSTSVVISKAISDKGEWLLETRTLKKAFFHKRDMEEAWKAKPIVSDLDNADTVLTQNILTWLSIIPIGAVISTTINFIIPQGFLWWVGGALITTLFTVPIAYFLVAHAYAHNWFNLRRDLPMTSQIEANCIDCAGAEGFTESHSLLWESVNQKDSYFRKIGARSIMIKTTEYEVTTDDEGAASGRVVIKGEVRIDSKLWGTQYFPIKQGVFDFATGEEAPFRMNITDKVIKDWIKQSRQQGARMGQRLNRRKFLEQGLLASLVALPIGYFSAPELREELFPVDTSEDIPFAFPPAIDDVAWMEAESSDNREGFAKVLDATITWLEQHNVYPDHLEAFKKLQEIASDESRIEIVTDKEMPDNIFRVQLHGSVRIDGALIGWTAETPHLVVNASKFDELFKLIQEKGSRELFLKLFALPLMAQTTKLSLEPGARAKLHAEARNSYKFEQEYGKKQKMPKDPKLGRLHHRLLYGPENDDKITKSAAYLFLPELYSARVLNDLLRRSEVYEGISLIDADENVVANLTEGVLKERWDYVQSQSVDQTAKVDQLLPIFITTLLDQRGLYLNHPRYGNAIYRSWIRSILARYLNQGYFPSYILQPAHQNEYIKKGPLAYPKDVYNKLLRRMLLISEDVAKELKFEKFMPDIIFNPPLPPEEADRAAAAEAKATDVEAEKESEDSKQEEAKKTTGGARLTVGDIDVFANAGLREVDSDNLLGRLSVDAVVRDGFKRLSLKPSTRDARVPIVFNQEEGWFDTLRVSDFADMDLRTDSLEVSDKSFGLGLSDGNRALDQLEEALRLLMGFVNRGLSPKIVAFVQSDLESSPRSETAIMNIRNSIVEGRWSSAVQTVTLSEDASGQDVLGIDGLLSLMSRSTTKTRLVLIAHPESINSITRRPEMAALISAGRMSVVPIGAPTLDAYSTSPWSLSVVTGLLMDEIARMDSVQRMRYLLDHWKVFKKMGLNFKAAEDVLIMAIFDELLSLKRLTQYAIKAIPLSPQIFRMLLNRTQVRMSA